MTTMKRSLAKKHGWGLLMTTILINGSDKDKFGLLKKYLWSQFNRGNDQYPKTVKAAQEILSKHCIDDAYFERRKQQNQCSDSKSNASKPLVAIVVETSFAQKEIIYFCCGKKGHASPNCTQRNKIPVENWYVCKTILSQVELSAIEDGQ